MTRLFSLLASALIVIVLSVPARGHGPDPHKEQSHPPSGGEEAMKAQHERMARFQEAARKLTEALILSDRKSADDAAALLVRSLAGHEKDIPHKNRSQSKEFHGLFVELGKRTVALRADLSAGKLPKAAGSYGRVLEICASCHMKFRD